MYKSVLVVDDVELSREILRSAVLSAGEDTKVVAVENAYAAINKLRHKRFDVVIMDIMMPNGDGFELMNMVSQLAIETKIIVISSLDRTVIDLMWKMGKLYELDIVAAIEKPINSQMLTELVSGLFNQAVESRIGQLVPFTESDVFDFPISTYYQPQVDTDSHQTIGIDVGGNWSCRDHRDIFLSNHLLPDINTISDKRLYNQILVGRFLQEYRKYFQSVTHPLSFTLHINPNFIGDRFIDNCLSELAEAPEHHELNLYFADVADVENASESLLELLSLLHDRGVGMVAGTQEFSSEKISTAKSHSVKRIHVSSEAVSTPNILNGNKSFDSLVSVAMKEQVDVLWLGVESENMSKLLAAKGLKKQQGLLFSAPVTAVEFVRNMLKLGARTLEKEV